MMLEILTVILMCLAVVMLLVGGGIAFAIFMEMVLDFTLDRNLTMETVVAFIVGMLVGGGVMLGFVHWFDENNITRGKAAYELIKECEATLPRNEHCELVAKPKVGQWVD